MKYLLWLLITGWLPAAAQHYTDYLDKKNPSQLLDKIRSRQATAADSAELQQMAIIIQNNGQRIDQEQRQYKKSLASIDSAIILFTVLNDTVNIANNRKYRGYLLGRLEKYKEAKIEIQAAADLYSRTGNKAGKAVCQFDLARMFELQDKIDSAIYYANISRDYWKLQGNDARVLITNNMIVNIWLNAHEIEKAGAVYRDSEQLIKRPGLYWQELIDFYYTSERLFKNMNDMATAIRYRGLYEQQIIALQKQGIRAISYYEMSGQ